MLKTVYHTIDQALNQLRARQLPADVRLGAYCRAVGEALLGMEISAVSSLACAREIRHRLEQTQALHRPHPLDTARAVTLEVLQGAAETAALFHDGAGISWGSSPAPRNRKWKAAGEYAGFERRLGDRLEFDECRGFLPCASMQGQDVFRAFDSKTFRRHLRQVHLRGRRPDPPASGPRGMRHV